MREIKFRAWDVQSKHMVYSDERDKKQRDIEYSFEVFGGKIQCWWCENFDDSFGYPTENSDTLDNIMQYTGLKDKNGVEIYEGDIFRDEEGENIVKYNPEMCRFEIDTYGYKGCMMEYGWDESAGEYGYCDTIEFCELEPKDGKVDVEVIGNIYENPELLEQEG